MKFKNIIIVFVLILAAFPNFSRTRSVSILTLNDLNDPESPSFVPYPYPETNDEIIEDLRYGIKRIFANTMGTFEYSLEKTPNPLSKILVSNASMKVQKILRVENRIAEMADAFSYLIILFDKETNEYARVALTADGLLQGFAVATKRARVKPIKSEKEIIALLKAKTAIQNSEISKINLMAYGVVNASPICPYYQVTLKDGSTYFLDYNEKILKQIEEIEPTNSNLSFAEKEKIQLKKDETKVYDSINEKILILKQLNLGDIQ